MRLQIGTATEERVYPNKDTAKVVNVKTISLTALGELSNL